MKLLPVLNDWGQFFSEKLALMLSEHAKMD